MTMMLVQLARIVRYHTGLETFRAKAFYYPTPLLGLKNRSSSELTAVAIARAA